MIKHYAEKEKEAMLRTMQIIVDTRENRNEHILDYLDKKNIGYITKKLSFGDYSMMIPKNEELCVPNDMFFSNLFSIERKASLEEISSNLTHKRETFVSELVRGKEKMLLMIEDASFHDIISARYNTQYNSKSFLASILTFRNRYGFGIDFVKKQDAGMMIHANCYYKLREYLRL